MRSGFATVVLVLPILGTLSSSSITSGNDWPQWRGPTRDGVAGEVRLPAQLPSELRELWRVEVGTGHSSPVVVGSQVYVFARQDDDEVVRALELDTGKEVWRYAIATPYRRNPAAFGHGKGPRSTPVVATDTLCVFGITGRLSCLDRRSGEVRWQHDFSDRFSRSWPEFRTATSPAVFGDKLVVYVGGIEEGSLSAFDLATGSELWSWKGDAPAYASPILVERTDGNQIVTQSRKHVLSVDPETGALLWKTPLATSHEQNSVTPVSYDGKIIASGLDMGVFALDVARGGRGHWMIRELWRNDDLPMYMSSPVLHDKLLFGLSHMRKGQLFCLKADTGKVRWTSEGREGDNASLMIAGERLIVLTTEAELIVAPASGDGFREEARYTVADSPTWAHPALLGEWVLVKDEKHLIAWSF